MTIRLNPNTKRITIDCSFIQFMLLFFAYRSIPKARKYETQGTIECDEMEQPLEDCAKELQINYLDDIHPSKFTEPV